MSSILPGIFLAASLAVPSWFLGKALPLIGGPVFGILLGMAFAFWQRPALFDSGVRFTAKKILQGAIILLGFEMNLFHVFEVGEQSLAIMLFTLSAAFLVAWLMGKYWSIPGNVNILIGVGTAICGGSAIAATAPVISASDKEVAYSISTVFLFNIAAVFIFPAAGHFLSMSDAGFGMWAGTAINDTSSVVAAGYSYSSSAGAFATIVKLTRTLTIVPVTLGLACLIFWQKKHSCQYNLAGIFPWFVLGFIAASIINTADILPLSAGPFLAETGKFCIVMAMAAIGLNTHILQLIKSGVRPILLGLSCWIAVAVVSLAVQHAMGLW